LTSPPLAEDAAAAACHHASMHLDESYVMRLFNAGARAYLLEEATDEDLLPAVCAVAAGESFFRRAVAGGSAEEYRHDLQERGLTDSYDLTDREKEVRHLPAEGRSNKEMAALLDVGVSAVETHRANRHAEARPPQHRGRRALRRLKTAHRLMPVVP
jgi:DNA-binding NarL/FixJ family response regulator